MEHILKHVNGFQLWHPEVMAVVVLSIVSYFLIVGPLRSNFPDGAPVPGRQKLSFVMSLLVMYIAMGTPIQWLGEESSFTVFMLGTILLMQVIPWLLLRGLPPWLLRPLLGVRWIRQALRRATYPIFSSGMFGLLSSLLFVPDVFSMYLHLNWFHVVFQFLLSISAILLWWPLYSPLPEYPKLTPGRQLLYLLYASGLTMPVNVLLLIAQKPWFPVYQEIQHVFSLTPLGDQQLGGLLMFGGMVVIYGVMATKAFWSFDDTHWGD